jgi:CopG-like RHH_1 or ribbon-helix-helix domain, RHH_5
MPSIIGMKKQATKQVWVRMPIALCKRIEAMAQAEDRTFASMLRVLTEEALDRRPEGMDKETELRIRRIGAEDRGNK